jgi:hypothetical protein
VSREIASLAVEGVPDLRAWWTDRALSISAAPPYADDMRVTPFSTFSDAQWRFPIEWVPINLRGTAVLDFEGFSTTVHGRASLDIGVDEALIRQLRELTVAQMFRRQVLAVADRQGKRARRNMKVTSLNGYFGKARRFMVGLKVCGYRSLADLEPQALSAIIAALGDTQTVFDDVAEIVADIMVFSEHGLIKDGLRPLNFELVSSRQWTDTSGAQGWQPYDDRSVAAIIRQSNRYIDLADDIAGKLAALRAGELADEQVCAWAVSNLPCGMAIAHPDDVQRSIRIRQRLVRLVHVAGGNLIGFHLGLRISEKMSLKTGFARRGPNEGVLDPSRFDEEARVRITTYKTEPGTAGRSRVLACHPRLVDVEEALAKVKAAAGLPGDYLFASPDFTSDADKVETGLPYTTTRWNWISKRFCIIHEIDVDASSHRWRKTIAALAVRVLTGAPLLIKELFGHASLAMTARYIMASPFIRDELRELTFDEYRKRGLTLMQSLLSAGGSGLGGRHGKELEKRFSKWISDTNITQDDLGQTLEEWVDEMLNQGIYAIPVMPGVFCMKPVTAKGACASSSGDRMADPARCSAGCAFQVQEAHRRDLVAYTIRKIAVRWSDWSGLQQRYWAGQCREQMIAWPELVTELQAEIEGWPALKIAMEEPVDAETA